jgi:hypothetical protein
MECQWTMTDECRMVRERSIAGISRSIPACAQHGPANVTWCYDRAAEGLDGTADLPGADDNSRRHPCKHTGSTPFGRS